MRLLLFNEGQIAAAKGRIINIKNELAQELSDSIADMGYPEPNVEFAETATDDAIVYTEAGRNRVVEDSQIVMVRIITDKDYQVQPKARVGQVPKVQLNPPLPRDRVPPVHLSPPG